MIMPTTSPNSPKESEFANEGELTENDAATVENVSDRSASQGGEPGTIAGDEVRRQPIGATPKSLVTGGHDEGSGANETEDGLTDEEELTRQAAEDLPTGNGDDVADTPVFDRRDTLPRV